MEFLTRTMLTPHESARISGTSRRVHVEARAVGQFVVRYGNNDDLLRAADLYSTLLEELTYDEDVRTGALQYGLSWAGHRAQDKRASQSSQLEGRFLEMLYRNAIVNRD